MSDPGDSGPPDGGARRPRPAPRAERLAEALRANLHRRKAQARGRRAAAEAAEGGDGAPQDRPEDVPTGGPKDAARGSQGRAGGR